MKLEQFIDNPSKSNLYIERYLNDGSPSGFSTKFTTSNDTSPFGLTPWFNPYICIAPKEAVKNFGIIPDFAGKDYTSDHNWMIVHPDMKDNLFFQNTLFQFHRHDNLKVCPTSSGRTVQIINKTQDFIKLHYEGILGRVWRSMPYNKAIAGPELSQFIIGAIDSNKIDCRISLFPETGARVISTEMENKINEWGMVWRKNKPYLKDNEDEVKYLIPIFSLFSYDRLALYDDFLLKQIIDFKNVQPTKFVLESIIFPIIECYFNLIHSIGLQPEWNAQNLVIGFDNSLNPIKFIMRDIESIDKDITMMSSLNINYKFKSYPYKCIFKEQYNYSIKHSFMYDYKLGDYIIEPLLLFLNESYGIEIKEIRKSVKDFANSITKKLPTDFFPIDGKWYVFDRVIVDQTKPTRPYIALDNPKFR